MKTRRKRIARPRRSTSRQRFRIKAPRLPNLDVSDAQRRELAGIGFLLLTGLLVLAGLLQTSGSAMHVLRGGLIGLFGWGVIFVILASLAAAIELLTPWIDKVTWGRGLGIALLVISALGLLHLSVGGSGGAMGRLEGEALRIVAGIAGSLLILCAVFLGSLVLAFDISLRGIVEGLQERYTEARENAETPVKTAPKLKKVTPPQPEQHRVLREDADEPVLVPINGVAAQATTAPAATIAPVGDKPDLLVQPESGEGDGGEVEAVSAKRKSKSSPEPVLTVVPPSESGETILVAEEEGQRAWLKPDLILLDSVTVRKERLHDEIKANIKLIEQTLASFDVQATVIGVNSGPSVTQYELQPGVGVPVRKITALQNDLALEIGRASVGKEC